MISRSFFFLFQEGDIIRTSGIIPKIPVRPVEGDSYPLGALPTGTQICLVQWFLGDLRVELYRGDESGSVLKRADGRVVIKNSNGFEYSLDERCQCVVGKVSIHPLKAIHIGSPNRSRYVYEIMDAFTFTICSQLITFSTVTTFEK